MTTALILLCAAAFAAGFMDAIVGGGGLIQMPSALILLPQYLVPTVTGTLKIPAFTGTFFAAAQYAKRISFNYKQLAVMTGIAFIAAFAGSKLLTIFSNQFMKPLLLAVLITAAAYTWMNKNFGNPAKKNRTLKKQWLYIILISLIIGFYDVFTGPGAGSFLVLSFINLPGFDFLKAGAHAKFVNLATNLGSIVFFAATGKIICGRRCRWLFAMALATCRARGWRC